MSSNLILGVFALLVLLVLALIIIAGIKMNQKITHNSALLAAHYRAMEARKAAKAAKAARGLQKEPPATKEVDKETGEDLAKPSPERNFMPLFTDTSNA